MIYTTNCQANFGYSSSNIDSTLHETQITLKSWICLAKRIHYDDIVSYLQLVTSHRLPEDFDGIWYAKFTLNVVERI
jgi:hypothetical protein